MKLIIVLFLISSVFINAQIDSTNVSKPDTVDNSKNIDEVTITQFSVKKLNSPISTDVYSQQFSGKIRRLICLKRLQWSTA